LATCLSFAGVTQPDNAIGVDLYMLWVAGAIHLPRTAEVCEDNNQDVHNTAFWEGTAFLDEWGRATQVSAPWIALRDAVQRVFSESAINTDLAGHALVAIAQNYAGTDAAASETMHRLVGEYQANGELPQPPGPLELENPGQPVQTQVGVDGVEVPVRDDDE
jgi:hypothetical protein